MVDIVIAEIFLADMKPVLNESVLRAEGMMTGILRINDESVE